MQTFKHGWKKEMDTWAGLVQEQIREQLLQQMEMSSDYQQVGSSKPEAVALSSVHCVSDRSRGHVLLIPIVLRRDAHTIFTQVEGKYRYLRVSDWCGVLIKHASTENTHTHPETMHEGFPETLPTKTQCRIHAEFSITISSFVCCVLRSNSLDFKM